MSSESAETWLVSVGAGRWQMAGIRSAQQAGIRVLALDGASHAPGLATADRSIVIDISKPDAVIDAIAASRVQIAGAISFAAEVGMRTVGALRERFSLPGPGREVCERLTDKTEQRRAWQEARLTNPRFWRPVLNLEQGIDAISDAAGPVIVKPADSAGSRGITRLDGDAGQQDQKAALERALSRSQSSRAIVESILPGREYTVETFADGEITHVLAITVKRKVRKVRRGPKL